MGTKGFWAGGIALSIAVTLVAAACGNDSTPTSPSPSPSPNPGGSTATTTITITANGVSPRDITVTPGSRVTFMNNDAVPHEMNSDPHPEHNDCPAINDVGFLSVGQTKTTGNLNTVRTCGYHDHNRPSVTSLQGTIRIQ